ncbi:MAG: hypothetical protein ACKVQV_05220 [Bacteroidia bacterium]
MANDEKEIYKEIIRNLKDFLRYLTSVWGLLSIFTPLFPFFNKISNDLHPPKLFPNLFIVFASLTGVFVIFYKFTTRSDEQDSLIARNDFIRALSLSIVYLIIFPRFEAINWGTEKSNSLVGLIGIFSATIEPILYIGIFWYFTQSFATLAVVELKKRQNLG